MAFEVSREVLTDSFSPCQCTDGATNQVLTTSLGRPSLLVSPLSTSTRQLFLAKLSESLQSSWHRDVTIRQKLRIVHSQFMAK